MSAIFARILGHRSIRTRLTAVGTAVLLAGIVLGGVAFDRLFSAQVLSNLDQTLTTQAEDRAQAVDAGVPVETVLLTIQRETAVAIFDTDGVLLGQRGFVDTDAISALSPGGAVTRPLVESHSSTSGSSTSGSSTSGSDTSESSDAASPDQESEQYRIVVAQPDQNRVVIAIELEQVDRTIASARKLLLVGGPLIVVCGGALLWLLTGSVLRHVERLRSDAAAIIDVGSTGRVHEPDTNDEISHLAETLNVMLARLDENAVTMRRFVSDASHEIRSPITNIRARIETASPETLDLARADIVGEVERVETLVNDLTYLAKSDERRIQHSIGRVELDEILFAEAERLQRRGQVRVDAKSVEPVIIEADQDQIRRVVRNLVDNAERHANSEVRLSVSRPHSDHALIRVEDDGDGIAEDDRGRVFERFARLDDSRERGTGGTGLGLAIVRDILDRHQATIRVSTSASLGGAMFEVELDLKQHPAAAEPI